ncbi:MAG: 5-formyltetrahydrofolate cyclo-ligase [Spongiibacteraceae bacterium]
MSVEPIPVIPALDKKALRRTLRQRRQTLSRSSQRAAALRVAAVVSLRPEFINATYVAMYLAADGELDPAPLIALARAAGKRIYLPVLQPGKRLRFSEWRPQGLLHCNRLGLFEPAIKNYRAPHRLDLVLMPLVGFDCRGGRLGMGGGFYDRTFAFLKPEGRPSQKRRPRLVGLAHALQQVDDLPVEIWDVPMTAVATDRGWITMRS